MTTQLDLELSALRQRRRSAGIGAWLRGLAPFDRRAIRDPDERDAYWANVQIRLEESDARFLAAQRTGDRPRVLIGE